MVCIPPVLVQVSRSKGYYIIYLSLDLPLLATEIDKLVKNSKTSHVIQVCELQVCLWEGLGGSACERGWKVLKREGL